MTQVIVWLLTSSAFAQDHIFCASAGDLKNKYHEQPPQYADGNGDGKADDYLMQRIRFKNTVLEEWCINGGDDGGYYIAWKLDGGGKPFRFIGKCCWNGGLNALGSTSKTNGNLTDRITMTSENPKTGKHWKYTYYLELGSIVAQKYDADGKLIPPGASFYPKEEPFHYEDLPGGGDPTYCIDVTRMRRSEIHRLREEGH
jgi:hypothetical protein